jgi:hypothetical protein
VPASAVQDQDDLLVWTCSHGTSEASQFHFKQGDADRRSQMKDSAA